MEIRELCRPEIGEVCVKSPLIGSSTMPHKRNPVKAERVSGLARILRGLAVSGFENIVLMHERDLSNSSFERITLPHTLLIIDQMLEDTLWILENLVIDREAMERNLELSKGFYASECLMVKLVVEAGIARDEAHRILSKLVDQAIENNRCFEEVVMDSIVGEKLSCESIKQCFKPHSYLGSYRELVDRAIEYGLKTIKHER